MHIVTHIVVHVFNFSKKFSTMILYTMSRPKDTVGMALKNFLLLMCLQCLGRLQKPLNQ